ncbi:MAG: DUF1501 domain-containing protein [Bacteroidota bacterium]
MAIRIALLSALVCALVATPVVRARASSPAPKAKAVIQIWMWGGPSHLDTFDPKPDAGYDYTGPLDKAIDTNVPGIKINAMLPMLAQQADKYSIIRGMTHGISAHETAAYMMQTGHAPGTGVVYPSAGAIVSYFKGYRAGYKGLIPPYIVLTELQGRFAEEGFLGPLYKPFATGGDPNQQIFTVSGIIAKGITDKRQQDRRQLLHALDTLGEAIPEHPDFKLMDQYEDKAYELILGETRRVFDLSEEPNEIRDRYGRNKFGQSCLQARRLVERGVPYLTINYNGWDSHKNHFPTMNTKLPEFDRAVSALLQDLSDRGLLDSTIVWVGGEFGRTPNVLWEAPWNGGRNHYGNAFSVILAGGGFRGGRVVGATDARGERVVERPVYPQDLIGSIFELLGIDPDAPLPNPLGLDLRVMPSTGDEPGKGRLREIM